MFPRALKRGLATSSTAANFASVIPKLGVADPSDANLQVPTTTAIRNEGDTIVIIPFGIASDNHTFDLRVIGWSRDRAASVNTIWTPVVICQLACTHCGVVGLAGAAVLNTERYCDTISVTNGVAVAISAPTDTIASAVVDITGFEFFEFSFDLGSGTDCNVLYGATGEEGV